MRLLSVLGLVAAIVGLCASSAEGSNITLSYNWGDGCRGSVTSSGTLSYGTQQSPVTCTGALGAVTNMAAEASLTTLRLQLGSAGTDSQAGRSVQIRVTDTFTVTGGSGSGTLTWHWAMDGTLDAGFQTFSEVTLNNFDAAFADFRACGDNVAFGRDICVFDLFPNPPGGLRVARSHETVNAIRSISIPFVFGVPLSVDWRYTNVIASGCTFGNCNNTPTTLSGGLGFFNTVNLLPLEVMDSNGNQVLGATVLSDTGFSYPTTQVIDSTPPVITPNISGTLGTNGWYRSNVTVTWSVTDPESGIASSNGCSPTTLTNDTAGTTLTCSATNGAGLPRSVPVNIKIDKTAPVISGMPPTNCTLWPPNHRLVSVATVGGSDALSGLAAFGVTGSSNEPENGTDDGDTAPDIVITGSGLGPRTVQLRAERAGTGTGRIYTLTATASDQAGNGVTARATCTVPLSQSR